MRRSLLLPSLVGTLENAWDHLDMGNEAAALGQLQAYVGKMTGLIASGKLPDSLGQRLLTEARCVSRRLRG